MRILIAFFVTLHWMDIANFAQWSIYFHAATGTVALLAGFVALVTRKGQKLHKRFGKVFYYFMLLTAVSALLISVLPGHENVFLFAIGIFSAYFVLSGYRALRFKKNTKGLAIDQLISWVMILTGIGMIFYHPLFLGKVNIVLTVFGIVGLSFAIRDILLFRKPDYLRKEWMKMHLGKMMGGYISSVTAFVVVNQFLPGVWAWLLPGFIGGIYITYWMNKLSKR